MNTYTISRIFPSDTRAVRQMDALLLQEGIRRDNHLDYSAGLYDQDYNLAAAGSCYKNTLRCLAVDSSYQGEGLLNQIVSHLIEVQFQRGNLHLFLYTKCSTALFFRDLGFYEIARVKDRLVFMENRKDGFSAYLKNLKKEGNCPPDGNSKPVGAVVMNANPFTLGHQYLLEAASADCSLLHVFIVSEEASLFPFSAREHLVKKGTCHLNNLVFHRTGDYMISNATFPSYFLKDEDTVIASHARLDVAIFTKIAEHLGITKRFVGEEPFSRVTGIYNRIMGEELARSGMECVILPRKKNSEGVISASKVRSLIHDGEMEQVKTMVPETTYEYLISEAGAPVVEKIKASEDVVHY